MTVKYKPDSVSNYIDDNMDYFKQCEYPGCTEKHCERSVFCEKHFGEVEERNRSILYVPLSQEEINRIRKSFEDYKCRTAKIPEEKKEQARKLIGKIKVREIAERVGISIKSVRNIIKEAS